MIARIASFALALAVITGCDRQDSERPTNSPPTGQVAQTGQGTHTSQDAQTGQRSAAGDNTRSQQAERPAGRGVERDYGRHDQSHGMQEDERRAALRACERLEGEYRQRCEQEVHDRSNPDQARLEGREGRDSQDSEDGAEGRDSRDARNDRDNRDGRN